MTERDLEIRSYGVSVFVLRRHPDQSCEVLLLQRCGDETAGNWCEVTGGLEVDEKAWQTALREMQEETGLRPESLYTANACIDFYDARLDCLILLPVFVAWVDPRAGVTLCHENSDCAWFGLEAALERLSYPAQRRVLRELWSDFVERTPPEFLRLPLSL